MPGRKDREGVSGCSPGGMVGSSSEGSYATTFGEEKLPHISSLAPILGNMSNGNILRATSIIANFVVVTF